MKRTTLWICAATGLVVLGFVAGWISKSHFDPNETSAAARLKVLQEARIAEQEQASQTLEEVARMRKDLDKQHRRLMLIMADLEEHGGSNPQRLNHPYANLFDQAGPALRRGPVSDIPVVPVSNPLPPRR